MCLSSRARLFVTVLLGGTIVALAGCREPSATADGPPPVAGESPSAANRPSPQIPAQTTLPARQPGQVQVKERFKPGPFTFVRVKHSVPAPAPAAAPAVAVGRRRGQGQSGAWMVDYPESDTNFLMTFQQETGLPTAPDPVVLELTDPQLTQHPFIYLVEGGHLSLNQAEAAGLRAYLLAGGFLMTDDSWGDAQWANLEREMKKVFPNRDAVELELDHGIFNCFYRLTEKPQVPSIAVARAGRAQGVTWEGGADTQQVHYRGIYDDNRRLMVVLCHNTDLGDGWERDGEDAYYQQEFSLKRAYPMGINIVVYALTH